MSRIGLSIVELILAEEGTSGFLARMSNPYWFQAVGCVMGMDWHSSGITTSVLGSLKQAVNPHSRELGIRFCGGRGRHSRATPTELEETSSVFGVEAAYLVQASKLTAKIDNSCIDDGYQLYLHSFILDRNGNWVVVQQGMNTEIMTARRYHWHSQGLKSFVDDPHKAIIGEQQGIIMNLTDHRATRSRDAIVDFIRTHPDSQARELKALGFPVSRNLQPELFMPEHHDVRSNDLDAGRLGAVLALAYEQDITDFPETLMVQGMGPRSIQALALVSEVVYGSPNRFRDPARFSFAHGGKDGHPFPVPLKTYDQSISFLSRAVEQAKMGHHEKVKAFKRLSDLSREIEQQYQPETDISAVIEREREISSSLGGRTGFGECQ
jgi:hypothetical protein